MAQRAPCSSSMPIARTVFSRLFAHARSRSLVTTAFNAEDGRSLETLSSAARKLASEFPAWLRTEMRTNHAGEYGAVLIYGGALRAAALRQKMGLETDNGRMREFAERHRAHEQAHLDIMMTLVPESNRSRLLPVWSVAAQSLGFFPALVGPRCLYWTVASVETFVEQHYDAQIARLRREGALPDVAALLERLCAEEVEHKDDAVEALFGRRDAPGAHTPGPTARAWGALVGAGSAAAVTASKLL